MQVLAIMFSNYYPLFSHRDLQNDKHISQSNNMIAYQAEFEQELA